MAPERVGIARLVSMEETGSKEGYLVSFLIRFDFTGATKTVSGVVPKSGKSPIDIVHEAFQKVQPEIEQQIKSWLN
jgi:hypothetical protein